MLEDRLDRISSAIENLTAALNQKSHLQKPIPKSEQSESEIKSEVSKSKPGITVKELEKICLAKVRTDRANRKIIKNLIADYDAELLKEIPEDKLNEFHNKLEEI